MKLYTVLFEKKSSLKNTGFLSLKEPFDKNSQSWFSLGHFDAIHTCVLQGKNANPFHLIRETNTLLAEMDCRERHFHPLYLISQSIDDSFWRRSSHFLTISRIHFGKTTGAGEVYKKLLEILNELNKDGEAYHLYRTIELCDAVLVGKSDNLVRLLSTSLTLRQNPGIARIYTYCGINGTFLRSNKCAKGEDIPLCTIRFAVSSFAKARDEIEMIRQQCCLDKEQPHLVTGVDDITVSWTRFPVNKLLKLYRNWFPAKGENQLDEAFSSITTRLGIAEEDTCEWPDFQQDENLLRHCDELETLCRSVVSQYENATTRPPWLRPLSELTFSLLRLSQMPVLDEFFYLMLPGVRAFLLRLQNGPLLDHQAIQSFIDSWNSVMEQIMRGEGQLTQYPQLRPPVFDIPVAMLEYVLAFLEQVSLLLQKNDEYKNRIALFPVPGLFQRIKASELFPPKDSLPGLVLIQIPTEMLYDSGEMQKVLCHELSHFIGEFLRNRERRTKQYAKAAAVLIAEHIFIYNHNSLSIVIASYLEELLSGRKTIDEMEAAVENWLQNYRNNTPDLPSFIQAIKDTELKNFKPGDPPLKYLPDILSRGKISNDSTFRLVLKNLSILFRECFADLCMLYFLPVSSCEYIYGLLKDMSLPSEKEKKPYELIAIRIYSVLSTQKTGFPSELLHTMNKLPAEDTSLDEETCNKTKEALQELITLMPLKKESANGRGIPLSAVHCLINYLNRCHEALINSFESQPVTFTPDEKRAIDTIFKNLDPADKKVTAFQKDMEKQLGQYQKRIGEELNKSVLASGGVPDSRKEVETLKRMYQNVNAPNMDFDAFQKCIEQYRIGLQTS